MRIDDLARHAAWRDRWHGEAAIQGEEGALACWVATQTDSSLYLGKSYDPRRWFEIGYVHTQITGEPSPWALAAAARLDKNDVLFTMDRIERRAAGVGLWDETKACWRLDTVQRQLYETAETALHLRFCS